MQVFADIDQYMSPSIITGEDLRPDLTMVHQSKDIYVSELTVGFEPNIQKNAACNRPVASLKIWGVLFLPAIAMMASLPHCTHKK